MPTPPLPSLPREEVMVDGSIAWVLLEHAAEYGSAGAAFQIGLAYETGHVGKVEMDDFGTIGVATEGGDLKSAIFSSAPPRGARGSNWIKRDFLVYKSG
jgi:hypothetical protein